MTEDPARAARMTKSSEKAPDWPELCDISSRSIIPGMSSVPAADDEPSCGCVAHPRGGRLRRERGTMCEPEPRGAAAILMFACRIYLSPSLNAATSWFLS